METYWLTVGEVALTGQPASSIGKRIGGNNLLLNSGMARNPMNSQLYHYVVISPAKDEEAYIDRTFRSMLRQTVKPDKWVIVDDGSSDRTPAIIKAYANEHDWIVPLILRSGAERKPGSAEIRAFQAGYTFIQDTPWNFIVKLDSDLELPPDYFERILCRFHENSRLGIASGAYLENIRGQWRPIKMPGYHAAGASKVVRRECFLDIGGFPLLPGWDTADEIKAQSRGWETTHFLEIQFHHLRTEGSAVGTLHTSAQHGEMYYACGGGGIFLIAKVAHRLLFGKPFFMAGVALLYGYLRAWRRRNPRLVNEQEAKSYRKLLNSRFSLAVRPVFQKRCD